MRKEIHWSQKEEWEEEEKEQYEKFLDDWEEEQKFLEKTGKIFEKVKQKNDLKKQKNIIGVIYVLSGMIKKEDSHLHSRAWKEADNYYKKQVRRLVEDGGIFFEKEILDWAFQKKKKNF